MSKAYSNGGVDFHLLKRKSKTGKAIYYVGFLSDLVGAIQLVRQPSASACSEPGQCLQKASSGV